MRLKPIRYSTGEMAKLIKAFSLLYHKKGKIDARFAILWSPLMIILKVGVTTPGLIEFVIEKPNEIDFTLAGSFARKNNISFVELPNLEIIDETRNLLPKH